MKEVKERIKRWQENGWSFFPVRGYGTEEQRKQPIVEWGQYRKRYPTEEEIED
ncbi:MAG: hypothetical protein QMD23_06795 [Candidatus Bathyarchaeia archaeon]|nr:hypothetical protein [Candidatus Bathyarchaeia archaeon]